MSGSGYPRHLAELRREMRANLDARPPAEVQPATLAQFVVTALGEPADEGKPARISGELRDRLVALARVELTR